MGTDPTQPPAIERDARIYFAGERTTLAWIRTGLALMGFGFVVARFALFLREIAAARANAGGTTHGVSLWAGTVLVLVGVWINLYAALRHIDFRRRFERGEPFMVPSSRTMVLLSSLLAVLGIGMVAYLVLLELDAL